MIAQEHLMELIGDSIINQGAPYSIGYKEYRYKRHIPGSITFAEILASEAKKINELPDLKSQLKYINDSEWIQWPAYMLSIKQNYLRKQSSDESN